MKRFISIMVVRIWSLSTRRSNNPYSTTTLYVHGKPVAVLCKVIVYRRGHYTNGSIVDNSIVPQYTSGKYVLYSCAYLHRTYHKETCACGRSYTKHDHTFSSIGTGIYKCNKCGYKYYDIPQNSITANKNDE